MEYSKWVPVCKWCGKRLPEKMAEKLGTQPPSNPPKDCDAINGGSISLNGCRESPKGQHTYMWERVYR